jgi:hypothetical protein
MIDPSGRKAERNAWVKRRSKSCDAVITPFRITASASSNDRLYLSLGTVRTGDLWAERERTLVVLTRQGGSPVEAARPCRRAADAWFEL